MDRVGTPVAVALGSNLGDRRGHLTFALAQLASHIGGLRASSIHETEPVGVDAPQPPYLNAVAVGLTALEPRELLGALMAIELARGRRRPAPHAPRTLDLDLILFGDRVIREPALTVPHPRFRERRFVLGPLAEIARGWKDPMTGKTVGELLERLSS